MKARCAGFEHCDLFRDADITLKDDPLIIIHCGVCESPASRRKDPASLFVKNGLGYLMQFAPCDICSSSERQDRRRASTKHLPVDLAVMFASLDYKKGVAVKVRGFNT